MAPAAESTFPNWPELRRLFTYDNLVGKVVQGRYEVLRRLGAGGMGVVFLARHVHLDKAFALKIISPRFLDDPELARRFLHEARAASKIDHPNVVSITDFGPPEEGPAFFAMEYLEGEDLAATLAREGPLPWPRALAIAAQIARALAAAHRRGVIHRDIKPQNCLRIARDGDPDFIKVLDFGLAKVLSGTGKNTWTVGGSPGYIAPEVYRGGKIDHRVDIFSLGVLLHTLLLGRLPAQAPGEVALPAGSPTLRLEDLPAPLQALIRRATDDDPARRFPDADAFGAAIAAARDELSRGPTQAPRAPRRWPLAAGALAGALALARFALTREAAPPPTPASDSAPEGPPASPPLAAPAPAAREPPPPAEAVPSVRSSLTGPNDQDLRDTLTPTPAPASPGPARTSAPPGAPPRPAARRPPPPFDEPAARALLQAHADRARACKAESSFRGVATTVRLAGTVKVSPQGAGTLELAAGYDLTPCLQRLVAGLRFATSAEGGAFAYTFLL